MGVYRVLLFFAFVCMCLCVHRVSYVLVVRFCSARVAFKIYAPYTGVFAQGMAKNAPSDQKSADRCMAQMHWNGQIATKLHDITQGNSFQALQAAVFTGDRLVEFGMIPPRLEHSSDLVQWLSVGLGLCAAMRMFRDGSCLHDAFAAVVNSNGLSAEYFG